MQYSAHRTIRHSKCIGISACLSPRTSDKSLTHPFGVLRSSKWRLSSWRFPFYCRRCFSEVSHPQQYSIVTRDTIVPMNIEVPTKYPLSQNDRIVVFEIRLHSESPMLYRPGLHGNWNALSLAGRALKDKFPTPTVPLTAVLPNRQVFLQDPVFSFWYRTYCCVWNTTIIYIYIYMYSVEHNNILFHCWLPVSVVTAIIRPMLYKTLKGWLHVLHKMLGCMGFHLHQCQYLLAALTFCHIR